MITAAKFQLTAANQRDVTILIRAFHEHADLCDQCDRAFRNLGATTFCPTGRGIAEQLAALTDASFTQSNPVLN